MLKETTKKVLVSKTVLRLNLKGGKVTQCSTMFSLIGDTYLNFRSRQLFTNVGHHHCQFISVDVPISILQEN